MALSKRKRRELAANYKGVDVSKLNVDLTDPVNSSDPPIIEDSVEGEVKRTRTRTNSGLVVDDGESSYGLHSFDVDRREIEPGDTVEGVVFEYQSDCFPLDGFVYPGTVEVKND